MVVFRQKKQTSRGSSGRVVAAVAIAKYQHMNEAVQIRKPTDVFVTSHVGMRLALEYLDVNHSQKLFVSGVVPVFE